MQSLGEDRGLLGLAACVHAAEDLDLAGFALGQEEVAVGRKANQPRVVEAGGVELHLEALGRDGPGIGGPGNNVGTVVDGLLGRGLGQVGHGQMTACTGRLVRGIGKRSLPGENGMLRRGLRRRRDAEDDERARRNDKSGKG